MYARTDMHLFISFYENKAKETDLQISSLSF